MSDQVQPRPLGQRAHERQRVVDRAYAERRMVERVDATGVLGEQRAHVLRVLRPQLAERAAGGRERAVHEHQQRPAIGRGRRIYERRARALQRRQRLGCKCIEAGADLAVHTLDCLLHDEIGSAALTDPGDDLDRR